MAKKCLKKNCKGIILDKATGVYCSHIENKIPVNKKRSKQEYPVVDIDTVLVEVGPPEVRAEYIEGRLIEFGLNPHEVELILLRCVDGRSMKDIVTEQGWVSINSASHYLRTALEKLRTGGFKL